MFNSILLGSLGLGSSEIIIVFFLLGAMIIPQIFYLITLQKTFDLISPENRKMQGAQVWMMFIPGFNIVWGFIIVNRMATSLKAEFASKNQPNSDENFGKNIGTTYCILMCCSVIPLLGILAALGALVCWIIYWTKISQYKNQLENLK